MRSAVRLLFIVVTAAAALVVTFPDIANPWHPFGTLGFEANIDGTVTHIYAGLPAGRAGITVGDRILAASGPRAVRTVKSSYTMMVPGNTATVTFRSPNGRTRTVPLTAVPFPRTPVDNVTDLVYMLSFAAFIVIAAMLLLVRPSVATWAFYLYAIGQSSMAGVVEEYFPNGAYLAALLFGGIASAIGSFALVVFALVFPNNAVTGRRRAAVIFLGAVAAIVAALNALGAAWTALAGIPQPHAALIGLFSDVASAYSGSMILAAAIAFGTSYLIADAGVRARLRWVILGAIAGNSGTFVVANMQSLPAISISPPIWLFNVLGTLNVLFPVAFSYALLKQRVIEVHFLLNRALVYSLVTTFAVGLLALVEFLIGQSLEATRIGLALEVAGAVAIGLGISRIHSWIDRMVDRYVFRSVYDAERHLERVGDALMFAQSPDAIDEMVVLETERALHLASVTVVRSFHPDEPLALRLLAGREAIDHDELLAVPLLLRHRLLGYVLYSHHANGAALDPNERAVLKKLSARAAAAYDHVASEARAAENERLQIEVNLLRELIQPARLDAQRLL